MNSKISATGSEELTEGMMLLSREVAAKTVSWLLI